ncbi:hypothetical protein LWI29_025773 [Acer saccharum]|uniref:RNase H type-1 domain-containing protein n=1 Tax=Acer saccharum TaxID=4024 RepID=A0AA39T5R3_ACESA|nr:hypothetical protein LWI29_025773 [Acer saccharum]
MIPHPNTSVAPSSNMKFSGWPADCKTWILYTDRASNQAGCRAGIVLIYPKGIEYSHCFRFEFKVTNNEAEYEAMLTGMKVATQLRADYLLLRSDSQLVIN